MIIIDKQTPIKDRSKEVLQRLKEQERKPRPKLDKEAQEIRQLKRNISNKPEAKPSPSFYQQRVERVLNKLNELEKNMKEGRDYFTAWWDYQKVAKEFLGAVEELEKFEKAFIPKAFIEKVNTTKIKVTQTLQRQKSQDKSKDLPPPDMMKDS